MITEPDNYFVTYQGWICSILCACYVKSGAATPRSEWVENEPVSEALGRHHATVANLIY